MFITNNKGTCAVIRYGEIIITTCTAILTDSVFTYRTIYMQVFPYYSKAVTGLI